jgi:hypothetical protein
VDGDEERVKDFVLQSGQPTQLVAKERGAILFLQYSVRE